MARKNLTEAEWDFETPQEIEDKVEYQKLFEANEKHYKELEKKKKAEDKRLDKISKTKTTAKDATRIEKEAEKIKQLTAVDLWMRVYGTVSFCNDTAIRALFHVFFGQMLREKKIYLQGNSFLDWRSHLNVIQSTGTGKGKFSNLFADMLIGMLRPFGDYCKVEKIGRLTVEALINTAVIGRNGRPKIDPDTGNMVVKKGLLDDAHIVILEESRQLLKPGKENEEIQEIFMTVCEPYKSNSNVYNKRLMNYIHPVETRSGTSWIGTTRPLGKIRDVLAISGLLQRTLFLPREVDSATRIEMNKKAALAIASKKKRGEFQNELDNMLKECKGAYQFAYENDITILAEDEDEIAAFLWEKQSWFMSDIEETISDSDTKEILHGFVSRYRDHMIVLAHHSAAMRRSIGVKKQDFEYAFVMMKELYQALKLWVETKVEKDYSTVKEAEGMAELVTTYVAANEGCNYKDLVNYISKKTRKTYSASSYHVKKLLGGQHRLIRIKNKKVYLAN